MASCTRPSQRARRILSDVHKSDESLWGFDHKLTVAGVMAAHVNVNWISALLMRWALGATTTCAIPLKHQPQAGR